MWKKRLAINFAIILVFSIGLLNACNPNKTVSIQVGGIYSLTGKAASYGKWVKNGVDLAVEEINNTGGINGKRITVISEDTQSDPKLAVSAFEKLISVNKIPAAVGFITSTEALACVPVAERAKVIMITPIAGTPQLQGAGKFVFRTRESGLEQSQKIGEYIYNNLGIHEAAILAENAANAIGYRDAFIEKFQALDGKIDPNLTYDEGQTDFRAVITQLKKANPKAVYAPGVGKVIGRVIKQANELGLKTQFFSSAGIEDPELFKIAGEAANGIIYGAPAFALDSAEPHTRAFVDAYKKKYGEDPAVYSANAYDAMMLIGKAMRAGQNTPPQIRDYLHKVKDYAGASGVLTFDKYGEVQKPVVLKRTEGNRFVSLFQ